MHEYFKIYILVIHEWLLHPKHYFSKKHNTLKCFLCAFTIYIYEIEE